MLAAGPELRAEQDRLDAAEAALDDTVRPDDPRVEEIAVQRGGRLEADEERLFEIMETEPWSGRPPRSPGS